MIDPHINEKSVSTTDRTLRQFAGLWVLFFGGLACLQYLQSFVPAEKHLIRQPPTTALILAAVAVVIGLPGLVWPGFIRPIFTGAMTITHPIGWVMSHVLLGVLFYLVFTPVALFFRLTGRDALTRRKRPELASYWVPKAMPTDVRSYFRQS